MKKEPDSAILTDYSHLYLWSKLCAYFGSLCWTQGRKTSKTFRGVGASEEVADAFSVDLAAVVAGTGAAGKTNDPMADRFSGGRIKLRSRCRDACQLQQTNFHIEKQGLDFPRKRAGSFYLHAVWIEL